MCRITRKNSRFPFGEIKSALKLQITSLAAIAAIRLVVIGRLCVSSPRAFVRFFPLFFYSSLRDVAIREGGRRRRAASGDDRSVPVLPEGAAIYK